MDFKNVISKITKTTMGTAEIVAQTAKEGSVKIAKKSEELVEVSKLTVAINSDETKIKDIYCEIGKIICEKHENGMYIDPELVERCNKVLVLKDNIKNTQNKIIKIKNKKLCPNCEEVLDNETVFCPKCGTNIKITQDLNTVFKDVQDISESNDTVNNITNADVVEDDEK